MCNHEFATIVNWWSVLGRDAIDWQCDMCGAFARNLKLPMDFDENGMPIDVDVNSFPFVDVDSFIANRKRQAANRVLASWHNWRDDPRLVEYLTSDE